MAKEDREVEEAAGMAGGEGEARETGAEETGGEDAAPETAAPGTTAPGAAAPEITAAAPDGEGAVHEAGAGAPDGTDTARVRSAEPGEPPSPGESTSPRESISMEPEDALAEARRAAQEHLDRALRAQAELENVRRRAERDLAHAHRFALERFVSELLPVRDSLELGLAASAGEGAGAAGIAEGVELTLRMLEQAMDKFGVEAVDPAGDPFNPEFHQAMTMQESDTAESGTVLTVIQKGYLLNERLVRPAMVIVAK